MAYMERLRSDRLRACGRLIQKMVRGWLARQRYLKLQHTVRCIQTFGRGMMARRFVGKLFFNICDVVIFSYLLIASIKLTGNFVVVSFKILFHFYCMTLC